MQENVVPEVWVTYSAVAPQEDSAVKYIYTCMYCLDGQYFYHIVRKGKFGTISRIFKTVENIENNIYENYTCMDKFYAWSMNMQQITTKC